MNRSLVAAVAACTLLVGPGIASADQLIEAAKVATLSWSGSSSMTART